jgi:gliding motility-associated-like protein
MRYVTNTLFCFLLLIFWRNPVNAQSIGGITSGASTYCSTSNSGFMSLTGYAGTVLNWEYSVDGGITWTSISNNTALLSYLNLPQTTCYMAVVQSGAFPPDSSSISCVTIVEPSNGGAISGGGTYCSTSGAGSLTLSGETGSVLFWQSSTDAGTSWTIINDTSVSLNYSGIAVNTIYSAVVQNAACPSDTSSFATFTIVPSSNGGSVGLDDTVCFLSNGGVLNLSGNVGNVLTWLASTDGGSIWTVLPGTSSSLPYSALTETTIYCAIVQNAACPVDTSSFATINVHLPFPVFAGNDTTISMGESLFLNGAGTGTPAWLPVTGLDSSTVFVPNASPVQTVNYILSVVDANGCVNTDGVVITVTVPSFSGIITTLFTPNGDGINDVWYIENIDKFPGNEVMIFNVDGQEVYKQKNYMNDWKGTYKGNTLPDGTYYYVVLIPQNELVYKGSLDILKNN